MEVKCDNIFCSGNGEERVCFWFDDPKKECREYIKDPEYGLEPDKRKSNAIVSGGALNDD